MPDFVADADPAGDPGPGGPTLTLAAVVVALLGGLLTGVLTMFLIPLRFGDLLPRILVDLSPFQTALTGPPIATLRVPLAVLVAVAGMWYFAWYARATTGWRAGPLLPAVGWFATVIAALRTTDVGDRLLMPDDWVAGLALFGGTVTIVVMFVRGVVPSGPARAADGRVDART